MYVLKKGTVISHVYLHLSVEPVVEQQVVCHSDPVRLHGVPLSVVVITDVTCRRGNGRADSGTHISRKQVWKLKAKGMQVAAIEGFHLHHRTSFASNNCY